MELTTGKPVLKPSRQLVGMSVNEKARYPTKASACILKNKVLSP